MTRHLGARRRPRSAWLLAPVVLCLAALAYGVTGSYALFHDTATISAGTAASAGAAFSAGSMATPTVNIPTQVATGTTVSWPATTVGSLGAKASTYDVYRYNAASGGTGTRVCTTAALSCVDTSTASGTAYYEVRAGFAASWTKSSSRVAFTPDRLGPDVTITSPTDCKNGAVSCGTASDKDTGGSTVSLVEYSLLRTDKHDRATCWDGDRWNDSTGGTCAFRPADGTTSWSVPGNLADALRGNPHDSYTLTVRATDGLGNVGKAESLSVTT